MSAPLRAAPILAGLVCMAASGVAKQPRVYYPGFPKPCAVYRLDAGSLSREEQFLAQSLAGLAAKAMREGRGDSMLWIEQDSPSYAQWAMDVERLGGASWIRAEGLWPLLQHFALQGAVDGYVLFRAEGLADLSAPKDADAAEPSADGEAGLDEPFFNKSSNVASSLASVFNAVIVDETLEEQARALGLKRLADAREMTERQCFDLYKDRFRRDALVSQVPARPQFRDYGIALGCFFVSGLDQFYEDVLAWLEPDSPVMGWNVGDEYKKASPVSRWGHFVAPLGLAVDLPALASLEMGRDIAWRAVRAKDVARTSLFDLQWEENRHYTAFVMSDGDNARWWIGSLLHDPQFWANPLRPETPMGWGVSPLALMQLAPSAVRHLSGTIAPANDLLLFANGYFYPDEMGSNRPEAKALERHLETAAQAAALWGLNVSATIQKTWDSEAAILAYERFARHFDRFLGMLAMQYSPYHAGAGRVIWIERPDGASMPVLSARYALWANPKRERMGSPARIAALINEAPYEGPPCDETYFDWTVVHAWSRFLDIGDSDDPLAEIPPPNRSAGGLSEAEGGVGPVQWLMRRLAPHVRVVAPEALLLLMRLHLRTAETLGLYLNGIERGLARMDAFALDEPNRARLEAHGLLEDARAAIERLGCDPPEQDKQAAFEAVRRAYAHAECARLALARFERRGEYVYCLAPPPIPDPFFYSFREGLAEYLGAAEACDHLAADRLEIRFSASPDEQVDMALTDIPLPISALRGRLARARIVSFQGRFHSPWIELPRSIDDAVREAAGNPDG